MTDRREYTDQDLSCYLDGEAAPDLMPALNTALKTDPTLQARLETLRAAQTPFDEAFEAALKLAPQMPALPTAPPRAANSNWKIALAGVAVGAIAAFGLTWATASAPQKSRWIDDVALYQSLYVAETLAGVNIAPDENQAQLTQISQTLGFDLTDLPPVAGLTLKRVQQLAYNGKPLAQITFVNAAGNPVALCVIRTNGENTPAIKPQMLRGQSAFTWSDSGFGILLIGPPDDSGLENAAKTFRNALKDVAI
jgi:anti-sigma factor RsiW